MISPLIIRWREVPISFGIFGREILPGALADCIWVPFCQETEQRGFVVNVAPTLLISERFWVLQDIQGECPP